MRRPCLSTVASIVVFLALAGVSSAGVNTWTTHGPEGGEVSALAIEPGNPSTLFAGTRGGGVFRSTDGATSWQAANNGPPVFIRSLTLDSATPPTLYAVADDGLFASSDAGEDWTGISIPATGHVDSVVADPRTPNTLYAGTSPQCPENRCFGGGVFKSVDRGATWLPSSNGIFQYGDGVYVSLTLTIDPLTPRTLYGLGHAGDNTFLYKSIDGGANWTSIDFRNGLSGGIDNLAIDPRKPTTLYTAGPSSCGLGVCFGGGVFKSTDGGAHWSPTGNGSPYFAGSADQAQLVVVDPTTSVVYVGGVRGVWKSTDGGASWTQTGLGQRINTLTIDPTNPGRLYSGDQEGVQRSTDTGRSWTRENAGIVSTVILVLAVDPQAGKTLYAGGQTNLYKSIDGGGSWTTTGLGGGATSVVCDRANSGTVYAVNAGQVVLKTTDAGASWQNIFRPATYLAIDPFDSRTLYAASGADLFKTLDGGSRWSSIATFSDNSISSIAVDPQKRGTLYVVSYYGVLKSVDAGANWTALPGSPVNTRSTTPPIAIDPDNSDTIYGVASNPGNGVFKSTDGGASWTDASSGLPGSAVTALIINPLVHTTLYAGTFGGVFKSADGGATWTPFNEGLKNANVSSLAIDPSGTELHAGTAGGGVFDYQVASPGPCISDLVTLCLSGARFRVQANWRVPSQGTSGHGTAATLTPDTGYFWFFNSSNVELIVKVLDGCGINGHEWVFAGGLTDVEVTLRVTDAQTGKVETYVNPAGTPFRPIQDTAAFSSCPPAASNASFSSGRSAQPALPAARREPGESATSHAVSALAEKTESCTADSTTLCLSGGRFKVQSSWRIPSQGTSGQGTAVPLSGDTGYFWFFSASNVEMIVKVLDACTLNSHKWVFAGGLTNVEVTLTVTDTQTGAVKTYVNPANTAFLPIQDTAAFATCP